MVPGSELSYFQYFIAKTSVFFATNRYGYLAFRKIMDYATKLMQFRDVGSIKIFSLYHLFFLT